MKGPKHLSTKTLERANVLVRNARAASLPLGNGRFPNDGDVILFFLTNGTFTVVIFCSPSGYCIERYTDTLDSAEVDYFIVKNIRHFIFYLAREEYSSWDEYHKDTLDALENGDIDPTDLLEDSEDL